MNSFLQLSVISSVLTLAFSQARAQEMLRISRIIMAQHVDSKPAAVYPEDAKSSGIEGTVALDVLVSTTGKVEQVRVLSGPDKLREAAKQAVGKWTYKPYMVDDAAAVVGTTVLVEFSLKDGGASRDASGDAVETATDARVAPPANSGASNAKPNGPVRVSGGVMAGAILHKEIPIYPYQAKIDHVSGMVVLHAVISKAGTVANLTVVSGDDRLQQASIDAVKKWTYRPYMLNGQPVEVDTMIQVNFNASPPRTQPTTSNPNPFGSGSFGPH